MSSTTEATTFDMLPVAAIEDDPENPRTHYDEEAEAELRQSIAARGVLQPIIVRPIDQVPEGGDIIIYRVVAGHRRLRAARDLVMPTIPARIMDTDESLLLATVENVVRSDLSPLDEARAYEQLDREHLDVGAIARMTGRSETTIRQRLALLALPAEAQSAVDAGTIPLYAAAAYARMAEINADAAANSARELADSGMTSWERAETLSTLQSDPRQELDHQLGDGHYPVLTAGSFNDPIVSGGYGPGQDWLVDGLLPRLGEHGDKVGEAYTEHVTWKIGAYELRRSLSFTEDDIDAARAFGALREWGDEGQERVYCTLYIVDMEWAADRLVEKIRKLEKPSHARESGGATKPADGSERETEQERRRAQREADAEARTKARGLNLQLGAAVAKWAPDPSDVDTAKLLALLLLRQEGETAVWAHRLCIEQPVDVKAGKEQVRYPRAFEEKMKALDEARAAVMRAKTADAALAVPLRLLVAQHYVDVRGLPQADTQGITEPWYLSERDYGNEAEKPMAKLFAKLAKRVAPLSVRKAYDERNARHAATPADGGEGEAPKDAS